MRTIKTYANRAPFYNAFPRTLGGYAKACQNGTGQKNRDDIEHHECKSPHQQGCSEILILRYTLVVLSDST